MTRFLAWLWLALVGPEPPAPAHHPGQFVGCDACRAGRCHAIDERGAKCQTAVARGDLWCAPCRGGR